MSLAKDLAATTALDENNTKVSLGSFWAERPTVVGLVRYFDSASCRKLVTALREAQAEIEARGAGLLIVGASPAVFVREFREAVKYTGPLVVDPSLEVFRVAGMIPTAAAKPQAPPPEAPAGLFGKMKAALNADVGKLLTMDVKDALTTDLVKLGQQGAQAGSPGRATTTAHDSAVFTLGPRDAAAFEWYARAAGDLPKIPDLLAALPARH